MTWLLPIFWTLAGALLASSVPEAMLLGLFLGLLNFLFLD